VESVEDEDLDEHSGSECGFAKSDGDVPHEGRE